MGTTRIPDFPEATRRTGTVALASGVAVAAILGIDALSGWTRRPLPVAAVADETAHLLTAFVVLLAVPFPLPRRFVLAALAASVAIDLDHLPLVLGSDALTRDTARPLTHGLRLVAGLRVAAARLTPRGRAVALGAAAGVLAHLVRDAASTPAGVPLAWPVSTHGFSLPYSTYLAALTCCAVFASVRVALLPGSLWWTTTEQAAARTLSGK